MPSFKSIPDSTKLEHVYNKVKLEVLPLLVVSFIFSYIDRTNISFAQLRMKEDLAFSDTIYGVGAGVFFIGYVLFEIPSNLLLHKIGARIWIARIMVTWGIVSAAMILVSEPIHFHILRFLLGVAEAGFFPGVILYLSYFFPSKYIRNVTALFVIGIPIAGLSSSVFSGLILDYFAQNKLLQSWQWLFLLEAIPSIILGLIVYRFLPNNIEESKLLTSDEKRSLRIEMDMDQSKKFSTSFFSTLKNKKVWLLISMGGCFSVGLYGIVFWLPSIVKGSGIVDYFEIAMYSALPWLCSVVGMLLLSRFKSTNLKKEKYFIVCPGLLGSAGLALSVMFSNDIFAAIIFLSIATTGLMCVFPGFWSLASFLGGASAAAGFALINSMSNIFGFLSPTVMGYLIDLTKSTSSSVCVMSFFIFTGCVIALFFPDSDGVRNE